MDERPSQMVPTLAATGAAVLTLTVLRRLDAYFAGPDAVSAGTRYLALGLNMALSVAVFTLVVRAFDRRPR